MTNPTACLLIIGNEVLSGRTQDANLKYIATRLGEIGIPLREVRVIPDVPETIVDTVNEVRAKYDHVFTTGGIGPTHDDITSECVAAAFGVPWEPHPEAWRRLESHYARQNPPGDFNAARQRMATMPRGAELIDNIISIAPGFTMGNVHVMAGVPQVFEAMLDHVLPTLAHGRKMLSVAIISPYGEGEIGLRLGAIQKAHPETSIGSYPRFGGGGFTTELIVRARDEAAMAAAAEDVRAMLEAIRAEKESSPA